MTLSGRLTNRLTERTAQSVTHSTLTIIHSHSSHAILIEAEGIVSEGIVSVRASASSLTRVRASASSLTRVRASASNRARVGERTGGPL